MEQVSSTKLIDSQPRPQPMDGQTDPLAQYSAALNTFNNAANPSPNTILRVLRARDQIQPITHTLLPEQTLRLVQLDNQLRQLGPKLISAVPLAQWRESLNVDSQAWWWHLQAPPHQLDRFDWAWNAGTVTVLTAAAGLVLDISSKFLVTSPGIIGSFALVGQSVLTLATAGGVLTDAGRKGIEQALASVGIRKYLWQETKFGLSLLLLLSLVGFRGSLPQLSAYLAQAGVQDLQQGELSIARDGLTRAISLDPTNANAHFFLGEVYAKLGQGEQAQQQYQIAVNEGEYPAFVALAHWYIANGEETQAAALINRALSDIPDTPENRELRSQLHTQLGQVRLNQARYDEAQAALAEAITLSTDKNSTTTEATETPNASPYCLLGETLDQINKSNEALKAWQQCLTYGNNHNPDEDTWMGIAQNRIEQAQSPQPEDTQSVQPQVRPSERIEPNYDLD